MGQRLFSSHLFDSHTSFFSLTHQCLCSLTHTDFIRWMILTWMWRDTKLFLPPSNSVLRDVGFKVNPQWNKTHSVSVVTVNYSYPSSCHFCDETVDTRQKLPFSHWVSQKSQPVTSASQRKHNSLFHICIITAAGQECEGTYKAQRTNKEVSAPAFF